MIFIKRNFRQFYKSNGRYFLLLSLIIIVFSSCSIVQNIPQEKIAEEKIKIFWDEHDEEDFVITCSNDSTLSVNIQKDEQKINPIVVEIDTSNQNSLMKEVNGWMGTPYRYGRCDKKGTDCSGFTMKVFEKVYGIKLNRSADGQVANTDTILKSDLQRGDLVFFVTRGKRISHVGIYIGDNKFVHATVSKGVMINDLDEKYYKKRYEQSGRVKRK